MAIMQLTALNGGMKGSIAGTTFQGGVAGQVVKEKPAIIVSPNGGILEWRRVDEGMKFSTNLAEVATTWKTLTDVERDTWKSGAVNYPFKNRFGVPYTGSGFQVYMAMNAKLLNAKQAPQVTCPPPSTVENMGLFTVGINTTHTILTLNTIPQPTGYTITLSATFTHSPGKKPQQSWFKKIYVLAATETFPLDFTSSYEEAFGSLPTSGSLWFKIEIINNITAQAGTISYYNLVY